MLCPRFCARAFSSCGERGPLFIAVHGPLSVAASPVVEHRLQMRRLSSCGSRAQLLRGMWDLPGPGLEPVSPALAGRFSTTAPPGKPHTDWLLYVEPSVRPWNESNLIMVYDPFYVLLDRFANIFLRIFASIFIKDIGLLFPFFVVSLYGFGIRVMVAS